MNAEFLGGKVTVRVQPFFWLMVAFFGYFLGGGSWTEGARWAAAVAFSVLFHECGHAAVCLAFGSGADMVLTASGGFTRPREPAAVSSTRRSVILSAGGCAAGGALAAAAYGVLFAAAAWKVRLPDAAGAAAVALFAVNLWFTAFNLLPISPMDGGKLVQTVLSARFGVVGRRAGHALGLALAVATGLWFLSRADLYGAFLGAIFALGEGGALRRALAMTAIDADDGVRAELARAAALWGRGEKDAATAALAALRAKTGAGLIHGAATLQLAGYYYLMNRFEESYALFLTAPEADMSPASKRAFADAARRRGDHALALRLCRTNFHDAPGPQAAAAAAVSCAALGDARETVHWLRTAARLGLSREELKAKEFDPVRESAEFRELLADLNAR